MKHSGSLSEISILEGNHRVVIISKMPCVQQDYNSVKLEITKCPRVRGSFKLKHIFTTLSKGIHEYVTNVTTQH